MAEIAKANGINVSGAELTKYAAEQTAELSDADLEAVAGGAWTDQKPTSPGPLDSLGCPVMPIGPMTPIVK